MLGQTGKNEGPLVPSNSSGNLARETSLLGDAGLKNLFFGKVWTWKEWNGWAQISCHD